MKELWFLFCCTSPPNDDVLTDGDNVCYIMGTQDKIQEEYQNVLAACEFPYVYMGRVLESATQEYTRETYADEVPM